MSDTSPAAPGDLRVRLVELYDTALGKVYGYLVPRCGSPTVAEDLTSETFLAAADAVRRRPPAELNVSWLIGIARHKLADHWRRKAREERLLTAVDAEPDAPDDDWDVAHALRSAHRDEIGPTRNELTATSGSSLELNKRRCTRRALVIASTRDTARSPQAARIDPIGGPHETSGTPMPPTPPTSVPTMKSAASGGRRRPAREGDLSQQARTCRTKHERGDLACRTRLRARSRSAPDLIPTLRILRPMNERQSDHQASARVS